MTALIILSLVLVLLVGKKTVKFFIVFTTRVMYYLFTGKILK